MDADNVGAPVTKQQWDYIHNMGDALRQSFENVSAVFAPSCISHSVLTKRDWQNVKIDDISVAEALHCWEQKTNNKRRIKQLRNTHNIYAADQPRLFNNRQAKRTNHTENLLNDFNNPAVNRTGDEMKNKRRKRRKHRKNKKGRKKKGMYTLCESIFTEYYAFKL